MTTSINAYSDATEQFQVLPPKLRELLLVVQEFHVVDDPMHVLFPLAVAATAKMDGPPTWGMIVGAASGGKTSAIKLVEGAADEALEEITAPGLLSWSRSDPPVATGLLPRFDGQPGLIVIEDFSSVLAGSNRGARDQLFAALRSVYDGRFVRYLGNSPSPLVWEGRLTLLAACTSAIDRYSSHSDSLGPRWLFLRLPERSVEKRRALAAKAREAHRSHAQAQYRVAQELAREAVEDARSRTLLDIPAVVGEGIQEAAMAVCFGRVAVERDYRREIISHPEVEDPPRVEKQLLGLAAGADALGLEGEAILALCRRVAADSLPGIRGLLLRDLARSGEATVGGLCAALRSSNRPVAEALQELELVQVVECSVRSDRERGRFPEQPWRFAETEEGALVRSLFTALTPPREETFN